MSRLIECVPNFSEGRRAEVVTSIVGVRRSHGVTVLDVHSAAAHNRSVVTVVGSPEQVLEAAFAVCREAARLIDMEQHRGEHPRIGATDVIPLYPSKGQAWKNAWRGRGSWAGESARNWAFQSTFTGRPPPGASGCGWRTSGVGNTRG